MTIPFQRILFPVDFSPQSQAIAPFVKAMARCFDSEVVALHVIDRPPTWRESREPATGSLPAMEGKSELEASVALDRFAAHELPGARVVREIRGGDATQQIVECAHQDHIDLIMLPTHGYGPFRELLLGSVTAKVLHDVHCPVWTGIHAEKMMSHSPDRWKRVLCALETDDGAQHVLEWASGFAHDQHLELQLVHAVAGTDSMWTLAQDPSMYDFLFHASEERLAKLQAAAGTSFEIRLLGGSVGGAVHKAALEYDADLIVIGRGAIQTALGWLRNRAYSIIREAPCPVISI